jgi:hypothetical protein
MKQSKFTINEAQDKFISNYDELGLKDKSAVVRQALDCLMERVQYDFDSGILYLLSFCTLLYTEL